jgi:diacylglycerol kinase (ATP)
MKHVFIVNPMAGASNQIESTIAKIKELDVDYEYYITTKKADATTYVREYIKNHPQQETRFYACGGDGTINEVVSGLVGADKSLFSMTCYPVGSGNDYIKIFGGKDVFMDLKNLVKAKNHEVDVMNVNHGEGYSINIINYGFDCNVVKIMEQIKRNKDTTNEKAYMRAVIRSAFKCRHNLGETSINHEKMNDKEFMLATIANGQYVGGQFKCEPKSICDDGLLDCMVVRPVSLIKLLTLLNLYKEGKHMETKRFTKIMQYRRTDGIVEINGPEGFCICLDGELLFGTHFEIENMKHAVNFAIPE